MMTRLAEFVRTDVVKVTCGFCQGEGTVLSIGQPGAFSRYDKTFLPSEAVTECPMCFEGELEVCRYCLEPLQIVGGREVCGCVAVQLPKAA